MTTQMCYTNALPQHTSGQQLSSEMWLFRPMGFPSEQAYEGVCQSSGFD